jgi:AcrR family transcriptional regulator
MEPPIARDESNTKQHILNIVEVMLSEQPSAKLRIADVAKRADVGVPTVYYYFQSRAQLVAQAQVQVYLKMTAPVHYLYLAMNNALKTNNYKEFWDSCREDFEYSLSWGEPEDHWAVVKVMIDIWSDDPTRIEFCSMLDAQMVRWTTMLERSKELGWTKQNVSTDALLLGFWSVRMLRPTTGFSEQFDFSPRNITAFFIDAMRADEPEVLVRRESA